MPSWVATQPPTPIFKFGLVFFNLLSLLNWLYPIAAEISLGLTLKPELIKHPDKKISYVCGNCGLYGKRNSQQARAIANWNNNIYDTFEYLTDRLES